MDEFEVKPGLEFTPNKKFYLAIVSLAALALVAALGSTSLSIALPVYHYLTLSPRSHQIQRLNGK